MRRTRSPRTGRLWPGTAAPADGDGRSRRAATGDAAKRRIVKIAPTSAAPASQSDLTFMLCGLSLGTHRMHHGSLTRAGGRGVRESVGEPHFTARPLAPAKAKSKPYPIMERWLIGVLLALLGCMSTAVGMVLMKHSTLAESDLPFLQRRFFLVGFLFLIVNASLIDVLAFSLAPLSHYMRKLNCGR